MVTVNKAFGAAMRGRPDENGKYIQQIELNGEEVSNCLTSAWKDFLVVEVIKITEKSDETPISS